MFDRLRIAFVTLSLLLPVAGAQAEITGERLSSPAGLAFTTEELMRLQADAPAQAQP